MRHRIKAGKVGSFTPEKQKVEIFNEDYFAKFISDEIMGSQATVKMSSFDGIAIEAPYMAIVGCTTKVIISLIGYHPYRC